MFEKRNRDQQCNHSFYVLETFSSGEGMMQLLQCQICQRKFWGYGGFHGKPKWVHAVPEKVTPLAPSSFYDLI